MDRLMPSPVLAAISLFGKLLCVDRYDIGGGDSSLRPRSYSPRDRHV